MIKLQNAEKTFVTEKGNYHAVLPTNLDIKQGDVYGIIGFSGAGKSTLLRMINLLEQPTGGSIQVDGQELTRRSRQEISKARQSIGMIFQNFNLLANKTARQNVEFALQAAGHPKSKRQERALECLNIVGLADKANEYPAHLSGGQKQRVAIARALANEPKVLLCDEPTSSLDTHTTLSLLKFLKEINQTLGVTIVIVTHEINVVKYICNRAAVMENGQIIEELDLSAGDPSPTSKLGKFLFDTANGWNKEELLL